MYGQNSQTTANTAYNLARVLDEGGGVTLNAAELISTEFYREYFEILEAIKAPKDKLYIEHFLQYLRAETNSMILLVDDKNIKKAIKTSKKVKFTNFELGNFQFSIGVIYASRSDLKKAKNYLNKSIKSYEKEYGKNHHTVATSWLELLKIDMREIKSYMITAQNDLLFWEEPAISAEKRTLRRAKRILPKAKEKIDLITKILGSADTDSYVFIDTYIDMSEKYRQIEDQFKNYAFSNNAYDTAEDSYETIPPKEKITNLSSKEREIPIYPTRAYRTGLEGWVLLKFDIDQDGKSKNVKLIEASHSIFVRQALYSASKFIYEIPLKDGLPTEVQNIRVRIDFNIEKSNNIKDDVI